MKTTKLNSLIESQDYFEGLIDERTAAVFLSVSDRTLQNWRVRGGGPRFVRHSKRCIRYRRRDLIAWAEDAMVESTSSQISFAA